MSSIGTPVAADIEEKLAEAKTDDVLGGNRASIAFGGKEGFSDMAAQVLKSPQLLLYKVQSNVDQYAWLLFFWTRGFKLFDHAVFVTYSLCFMLTLGTLAAVVVRLPKMESAAVAALLVILPTYLYQQVRHADDLSHFSAA
jgi:hypothetical protein